MEETMKSIFSDYIIHNASNDNNYYLCKKALLIRNKNLYKFIIYAFKNKNNEEYFNNILDDGSSEHNLVLLVNGRIVSLHIKTVDDLIKIKRLGKSDFTESECTVCYEKNEKIYSCRRCGNVLCDTCIDKIILYNISSVPCPICRYDMLSTYK